jgi:hypothetical protein
MRLIKNTLIKALRKFGVYPTPLISKTQFLKVIELLRPINNGHELIRIGGLTDGGYLIPNDLLEISACISPGVAETIDFELDIWNKFRIPSYMYDASVNIPEQINSGQHFFRKFVGPTTYKNFISLHDIIHKDLKDLSSDFIGQIDIESAEYGFLTSASFEDLSKFRILVIEFHEVDRWIQSKYFTDIIEPLFDKIGDIFSLVHAHPNNNGGSFKFKGKVIPNVIELTFHRKDRLIKNLGYSSLPHRLDSQNVVKKKDLFIH